MITRLSFLILLSLTAIFTAPILAIPLAFWYALRYFAPELILLAGLIDAYFSPVSNTPYYTLAAFMIVLATQLGKKYIMIK